VGVRVDGVGVDIGEQGWIAEWGHRGVEADAYAYAVGMFRGEGFELNMASESSFAFDGLIDIFEWAVGHSYVEQFT